MTHDEAIKPEVAHPMHCVGYYKHAAFVAAQAAILRIAASKTYVSPADVPETVTAADDRQGVASNAWNSLRALGILERMPLAFTDASREIYAGRTRNTNPGAKGRWVAVYRLTSLAAAKTWMERNGQPWQDPGPVQLSLV